MRWTATRLGVRGHTGADRRRKRAYGSPVAACAANAARSGRRVREYPDFRKGRPGFLRRALLTAKPALVRPIGLTDLRRSHFRTGRPYTDGPTNSHGGGLAEVDRDIDALPSGQDHIARGYEQLAMLASAPFDHIGGADWKSLERGLW